MELNEKAIKTWVNINLTVNLTVSTACMAPIQGWIESRGRNSNSYMNGHIPVDYSHKPFTETHAVISVH